jgi:hypothetical protein
MKTFPAILLLAVAMSGCASNQGNPPVCGDRGTLRTDTTQTVTSVKLKERTSAPMLYWIADHYAVLMSSDSVINLLQSWAAQERHSRHTPTLLNWIKAEMPLADDTDLHKYIIRDARLERLPQYIAAALLETGDASVIDLWQLEEAKNLTEIDLLRLESSGGRWRYFCEPAGEEIFWVTDMIVELPLQGAPNNRLEFALAHPTRKSAALLLAAQPQRYAPGQPHVNPRGCCAL